MGNFYNAFLGFSGVVIGSLLTAGTNILINYKKYNLEKYKITRELDLKKVNVFLKPALNIYAKQGYYADLGDMHNVEFTGKGLSGNFATEFTELLEKNIEYADMDILRIYFIIKRKYENEYVFVKQDESNSYQNINHNIFDNSHELFEIMNKRANELEEKHTK